MLIEFKAINASIIENYGSTNCDENPDKPITKPESGTRLHYEICTTDGLTLATGQKLKELRGALQLTPNADPRDDQKCIGYMSYSEGSRMEYIISIPLPKPQFDKLRDEARLGYIPSEIRIEFRSKFIDSDGFFDYKWDNKSGDYPHIHNQPYVASIDFVVPLAETRVSLAETRSRDGSRELIHDDFLPPTRLQTRLLTQLVQKVSTQITTQIFWLITVVAILGALVVVFK